MGKLPVVGFVLALLIASWAQAIPLRTQDQSSALEIGLDQYGDSYQDRSGFEKAVELLRKDDLAGAKEQFAKLQAQYPYSIGVLELGGLVSLLEGEYADAERQFRQAIDVRDDISSVWSKLGSSLIAQDKREEGSAALQTAVKLDPKNTFAHHILARLAVTNGKLDLAIAHYADAVDGVDRYSVMHLEYAQLLMGAQKPEEAIAVLSPVTMSATTPQALLALAAAQAQRGDASAAIESVDLANERFPTTISSWTGGLSVLLDMGAGDAAVRSAEAGRERFPKDPVLKFQYANALQISGNVRAAEGVYRDMFKEPGAKVLAMNNLAAMLTDQPGRGAEAVSLAKQAAKLSDNNPAVLDTLGWAQYRNGQAKAALQTLTQAAQVSDDGELLCHLALVSADVNTAAAASDKLQQCTTSNADSDLRELAAQQLQ